MFSARRNPCCSPSNATYAAGKPFFLVALFIPRFVDIKQENEVAHAVVNVKDERIQLTMNAAEARWRVVEHDVTYRSRTGGVSKVSGSVRGSFVAALDFWRVIR